MCHPSALPKVIPGEPPGRLSVTAMAAVGSLGSGGIGLPNGAATGELY
jgi:hypothetical protein